MRYVLFTLLAASLAVQFAAPAAAEQMSDRLWPPGSAAQQATVPGCAECWVQEVAAQAAAGAPVVPPANPTCYGQPSIDFYRTALAILGPRVPAGMSADLGRALRTLEPHLYASLREGSAADFRVLMDQPPGRVPYANCAPLAVLLPEGAVVTGVRAGVQRAGVVSPCDPVGGACGGGGRLVQPPEAFAAAGRIGVGAVFMSGADTTGDVVGLFVGYRMPADQRPVALQ